MSGLLSSLALVTTLTTSIYGLDVPDAPELEDQMSIESSSDQQVVGLSTHSQESKISQLSSETQVAESADVVKGVDISSHQMKPGQEIDIPTMVHNGDQSFSIIKATEGTTYINPHFVDNMEDFVRKEKPVGFYHYARPTANPNEARDQARFFINTTELNAGVRSLPPVLDIEESEGLNPQQLSAWTREFVDEVKNLTGRDTMIYTYPSFWRVQMGNTTEFSNLPLWLASYTKTDDPGDVPGGWDYWTFWQYSSSERVQGYQDNIDANVFRGSEQDLWNIYRVSYNKESRDMLRRAIAETQGA